jgi:hypothetical protein
LIRANSNTIRILCWIEAGSRYIQVSCMRIHKSVYVFVVPLIIITLLPGASIPTGLTEVSAPLRVQRLSGTGHYYDDLSNFTYRNAANTNATSTTGEIKGATNKEVDWLETYETNYPVTSLAVQGQEAFISLYSSNTNFDTLQILDISNTSAISRLSTRSATNKQTCIVVSGDFAAVGTSWGRINLYNFSHPTNLLSPNPVIGHLNQDENITDMAIQGHHLYVTHFNAPDHRCLNIYDIEDPENVFEIPKPPGFLLTNGTGLDAEGDILYMSDGTNGVMSLDVSDPYSVSVVGNVDMPDAANCTDILVDGNKGYVAADEDGVFVIDTSDHTDMRVLGHCDTLGEARKLALRGNTLFVADGSYGLLAVDVSNPRNPDWIHYNAGFYGYDVAIFSETVLVGSDDGVRAFRMMHQSDFYELGTYYGRKASDIRVQGDIAYVAGRENGLYTLNVSDPANPIFLTAMIVDDTKNYVKLDVQGRYAYVADYGTGGGLRVFDVSNPKGLSYMGTRDFSQAMDVDVEGDVAFVANGNLGAWILNVSDPTMPMSVSDISVINGIGNVTTVCVQGHHLYVANAREDVGPTYFTYDITDLENPVLMDSVAREGLAHEIAVDGDIMYVNDGNSLRTYNLTPPNNLQYMHGMTWMCCNITGLWPDGNHLVVSLENLGLYLLDVRNPSTVNELDYEAEIDARGVYIHGDNVYCAAGDHVSIYSIYRNQASSWFEGLSVAESLEVDDTDRTILRAALQSDLWHKSGVTIQFYVSADGGVHWETVSRGVEHEFAYPGTDLRWRVHITTDYRDRTGWIYDISIDYTYNEPPDATILDDPGGIDDDGNVTLTWSAANDSTGTIDYYSIQMSVSETFDSISDDWVTSSLSQDVEGLENGTYYFRVQAVDAFGFQSPWSNTEDIIVAIPSTITTTTTTTTTGTTSTTTTTTTSTSSTTWTTTTTTSTTTTTPFTIPEIIFGISTWIIIAGAAAVIVLVTVIVYKKR